MNLNLLTFSWWLSLHLNLLTTFKGFINSSLQFTSSILGIYTVYHAFSQLSCSNFFITESFVTILHNYLMEIPYSFKSLYSLIRLYRVFPCAFLLAPYLILVLLTAFIYSYFLYQKILTLGKYTFSR